MLRLVSCPFFPIYSHYLFFQCVPFDLFHISLFCNYSRNSVAYFIVAWMFYLVSFTSWRTISAISVLSPSVSCFVSSSAFVETKITSLSCATILLLYFSVMWNLIHFLCDPICHHGFHVFFPKSASINPRLSTSDQIHVACVLLRVRSTSWKSLFMLWGQLSLLRILYSVHIAVRLMIRCTSDSTENMTYLVIHESSPPSKSSSDHCHQRLSLEIRLS